MEEILDFDIYINNSQKVEKVYHIIFDKNSGRILELYPSTKTVITDKNKLEISVEDAKEILESPLGLMSYRVTVSEKDFKLVPINSVDSNSNRFIIDDVLHRIPNIEFTKIKSPDIKLTYFREKKLMTLSVKKNSQLTQKFLFIDGWIKFFITRYNDPNVLLFDPIEVNILDTKNKKIEIKNLILPEDFSVYTRRIFKNYVLEVK